MAAAFISRSAFVTIVVCAVGVFILLLILVIVNRCRRPESYSVVLNPDEDVRENIIHYNEEGVGEEDQTAYDINKLKKPLQDNYMCVPLPMVNSQLSNTHSRDGTAHQQTDADYESLDNSINNRLHQIESDPSSPPYDTVREYAYEGSATSTRSLSSIESATPNGGKDKCASCNSTAPQGASLLPNRPNNCNSVAAFRPTVNFKNRQEKHECSITTDI